MSVSEANFHRDAASTEAGVWDSVLAVEYFTEVLTH